MPYTRIQNYNLSTEVSQTFISVSANNFVLYNFPLGDFGFLDVSSPSTLGDENIAEIWDNKTYSKPRIIGDVSFLEPLANNTLILDAGYLT
jgi:hypothetical protein